MWYLGLVFTAMMAVWGMIITTSSNQTDEQIIRQMVENAIARLNKGDLTAFDNYWDKNADYVGVDGSHLMGRDQIKQFYDALTKASAGQAQQIATIEKVRLLTSEFAIVDGAWTITGAKDSSGKELPPIKGRGVEFVQKKEGKWQIVATREMVIFKSN